MAGLVISLVRHPGITGTDWSPPAPGMRSGLGCAGLTVAVAGVARGGQPRLCTAEELPPRQQLRLDGGPLVVQVPAQQPGVLLRVAQ